MTTEDYANELLAECPSDCIPKRWAFIEAIDARGCDARTKQYKHYDRIVKWIIINWADELEAMQPSK